MAQSNPIKALAVLSRRWKPYGAWANRPAAARKKQADLLEAAAKFSEKSKEQRSLKDRSWAIHAALSQAEDAVNLSQELASSIRSLRVDDRFRAELLLGYIAGLPKRKSRSDQQGQNGE
jgi:hypothetical protein